MSWLDWVVVVLGGVIGLGVFGLVLVVMVRAALRRARHGRGVVESPASAGEGEGRGA